MKVGKAKVESGSAVDTLAQVGLPALVRVDTAYPGGDRVEFTIFLFDDTYTNSVVASLAAMIANNASVHTDVYIFVDGFGVDSFFDVDKGSYQGEALICQQVMDFLQGDVGLWSHVYVPYV